MNVLLIEDNDELRGLIRESLETIGAIVTEAESPVLALRTPTHRLIFDLIVTDIDFPVIDGFMFVERVERTFGPQRIMFISGTDYSKYVKDACTRNQEAVWDFARKPFSWNVFHSKIRGLMARNSNSGWKYLR